MIIKAPLQLEINTNEQWEQLSEVKGLGVVDVYSEWCGPCSWMILTFKKLRRTVGNELYFASAKSDNVACLERFRNKSEPTWIFIVEGKIVKVMFGANVPLLIRTILVELKKENAFKEGDHDRAELEMKDLLKDEENKVEEKPVLKAPPEVQQPNKDLIFDEDKHYRPF